MQEQKKKLKQKNTQNAKIKQNKKKLDLNLNQHSSVRTAYMSVHITVQKCHTQHITEHFL